MRFALESLPWVVEGSVEADVRRQRAMQDYAGRRMRKAGFRDLPHDAMAADPAAANRQLEESVIGGNSFLGLGIGAVSRAAGRLRYVNVGSLRRYSQETAAGRLPIQKGARLTPRQNQIDFLLNRLWYGGVTDADFRAAFALSITEAFPDEFKRLEKCGALRRQPRMSWSVHPERQRAYFEIKRALYEPEIIRALTRPSTA